MIYVGIDPDLHDTAVAWCNANGDPVGAYVVRVPKGTGIVQHEAAVLMLRRFGEDWRDKMPLVTNKIAKFAVEGQSLMRSGHRQHKRPQDIVILGNVAGGIIGVIQAAKHTVGLEFPPPEVWKGGVAKSAMQARLYNHLGWGYKLMSGNGCGQWGYAIPINKTPPGFDHIRKTQWKHVGDALLLARWLWKKDRGIK